MPRGGWSEYLQRQKHPNTKFNRIKSTNGSAMKYD